MRLISLTANKPSFRPIQFNREGLSFILAEQKTAKTNRKQTYNGVGKSLTFAIIDFCLGSNQNDGFKTSLKGWVFYLTVEFEDGPHIIARSADKPKGIWLDEKKVALASLKQTLSEQCFVLPSDTSHLTLRSLIGRFLRLGKTAYNTYRYANASESKDEYGVMLRNAFLLGLDPNLARKKRDLRKQFTQLEKTMNDLENDPDLSRLLAGDEVDVELTTMQEQADSLKQDLSNFKVAENYHEIEIESTSIKSRLDGYRREKVKLSQAITQIDRSLKAKTDISLDRIRRMYEEAEKVLPESLIHSIEEVLEFQTSLKAKRTLRLTQDRQAIKVKLDEIEQFIVRLSVELDDTLRFLGSHRALDEYVAVNQELADIQVQIARLEESKAVRQKVLHRQREIKLTLAQQNIQTAEYLDSAGQMIEEANDLFRKFAKRLYGVRKCGLTVSNNEGENQTRYNIESHIRADDAEGINEAKIFCYDLMVLSLGRNHSMRFVAHDSTLFGPIDPRQRFTMLQIAREVALKNSLQYIVALNEHDVSSIESQLDLPPGEFSEVFSDNAVVLHLSDEKPSKKLLGISVDMKYTKE